MGEDPRGFLCHSQHGKDQRDKCRAELLTNAFAAAEQVMRMSIHTSISRATKGAANTGPRKGVCNLPGKKQQPEEIQVEILGREKNPETRKQRTVSKSSYVQEDLHITHSIKDLPSRYQKIDRFTHQQCRYHVRQNIST